MIFKQIREFLRGQDSVSVVHLVNASDRGVGTVKTGRKQLLAQAGTEFVDAGVQFVGKGVTLLCQLIQRRY